MERNKDSRARQRPAGGKISGDRKVSPWSREGTGPVMFRAVARFHLFCVLVIFAVAPTCVARVIAVKFVAEVTNVEVLGADKGLPDDGKLIVESFQIGGPVEGVYTYDTSAPDRAVDSHYGEYGFDAQPFGVTVSANGFVFKSDPMNVSLRISVGNDVKAHEGPGEWFRVRSDNNVMIPQIGDLRCGEVSLELGAYWWPDGGPLIDDSLPTSAPTLDQWHIRTLTFTVFVGFRGPAVHVSAVLTSAELLPEPARVLYVDAAAAPGGDGSSWPTAYSNLQAAIDDANDGDTVLVAPGTYTGDGNRDIDFGGKAITVRSEQGPDTCIIDCQSYPNPQSVPGEYHRGFHFHSAEDDKSILQGFTITHGQTTNHEPGGGILCENSSPQIVDCVIVGNGARYGAGIGLQDSGAYMRGCLISGNTAAYGGGVWCLSPDGFTATATFERCIISGNHAVMEPRFGGEGGGVSLAANARFANCVLAGNLAGYRGGGICSRLNNQRCEVVNCIIWANERGRGDGHQISTYSCRGLFSVSYTVIQDGNDHINDPKQHVQGQWQSTAPCFAQDGYWTATPIPYGWEPIWTQGDYHLKSQGGRWDPASQSWVIDDVTSLCIDAGDPNSPVGEEPFPNGGRINMGAYGGTAEASKSWP